MTTFVRKMLSPELYRLFGYYLQFIAYFGTWSLHWCHTTGKAIRCTATKRKCLVNTLLIFFSLTFTIRQLCRFYGSDGHFDDFNVAIMYGFVVAVTFISFLVTYSKEAEVVYMINIILFYLRRTQSKDYLQLKKLKEVLVNKMLFLFQMNI